MPADVSGGRVCLVPLDRRHMGRTRDWANDPELMKLMDRGAVVGDEEHERWFASLGGRDDCAYFAIETPEARHVGNIWLWAIDRRHLKAELRVVIGEQDARGRGIGSAAIDALCRRGFDRLGLHRIYAYVLAMNVAAQQAFRRAGFMLEGTLRDDRRAGDLFVDVVLLARVTDS